MSPAPKRPFRSIRPQHDPERTMIRIQFLDALDHETSGKATQRLEEARPAFEQLASVLESSGVFEPWWLSRLPRVLPSDVPPDEPDDVPTVELPESDGKPDPLRFPAEWREDVLAGVLDALSPEDVDLTEPLHALREVLREWAVPYHLHEDEWVADHLSLALQTERFVREAGGKDPLRIGLQIPFVAYDPPRTIHPPRYRSDKETSAEHEKRVSAYREAVEMHSREQGWEPAPTRLHLTEHLRWLVRHHCLGRPYHDCGRADESNIRKAITALTKVLPLSPRPAPGRPPVK